jgi:IS30 family transposase
MGQIKTTTREKKNKYLSETERWKIEALREKKISGHEIARQLGRCPSTINREIERGTVVLKDWELKEKSVYRADYAQRDYEEKRKAKGRPLKIGYDHELSRHIENKINKDKYSPSAIVGEIKQKKMVFKTMLCPKTIYNYVYSGVLAGVNETKLAYVKNRKKRYRKLGKVCISRVFKSIDERPKEVETRLEYGHWEMDIVKGKQKTKGCLLTLTERKTRDEIIKKLKSCTTEEVAKALNEIEEKCGNKFAEIFKTMTVDNGSEFLGWELLERSVLNPGTKRTSIFYAHPYSSFERGTNENANRLIRRFIPKGIDIGKIAEETITTVQNWINNYPRSIFGYKTANDMVMQNLTRNTCRVLGLVQ